MKQLKLNTAWLNDTEAYSDVELGRLLRGMLKYASSGEEPKLTGNERMMWPKARAEIDDQRRSHDRQQAGNRKRHDEASCGMMGHDEASCGIEKAYPPSPPTPPVIPPKKERKKTSPKGESKERSLSPALADALSAFREMRNRMRKPMTPLAVDLLIQKLEKLAPGDEAKQVAMLMQSIENGWTGVYELKQEAEKRRGRPKSQTFFNYDEHRDESATPPGVTDFSKMSSEEFDKFLEESF